MGIESKSIWCGVLPDYVSNRHKELLAMEQIKCIQIEQNCVISEMRQMTTDRIGRMIDMIDSMPFVGYPLNWIRDQLKDEYSKRHELLGGNPIHECQECGKKLTNDDAFGHDCEVGTIDNVKACQKANEKRIKECDRCGVKIPDCKPYNEDMRCNMCRGKGLYGF